MYISSVCFDFIRFFHRCFLKFFFCDFAFSFYPIIKNSLTSWRSTVASRPWGWRSLQTHTQSAPQSARRSRSGPLLCLLPRHTALLMMLPPGDAAWTKRKGSVVHTAPGTYPGNGGRHPHGNGSLCCSGDRRFETHPPLPWKPLKAGKRWKKFYSWLG